jgi:hypothetical protein
MREDSGGDDMADHGTREIAITLPEGLLAALDTYIERPELRRDDVFWRHQVAVGPDRAIHVVVKHDLFEGVVVNVDVMDQEAYRQLGGVQRALARASDLTGAYAVETPEGRFRVALEPAPA